MTAFTAYLKTKLVLKTRSPITTFFELVSPALFVGILVLGYFLSDIDTIEAGLYAVTHFDVRPLFAVFFDNLLDAFAGDARSYDTMPAANASAANATASTAAVLGTRDLWDILGSVDSVLSGPLPIIPLDVFVGIGVAVREALSPSAYAKLHQVPPRNSAQFSAQFSDATRPFPSAGGLARPAAAESGGAGGARRDARPLRDRRPLT